MLVALIGAAPLPAADVSPALIGRFTKQVQPLVLNKCAAGACHGGPSSHAPQFLRGDLAGRVDRQATLANLETLLGVVDDHGDIGPFLRTISSRHPGSATSPHRAMAPLSPAERAVLELWLRAASASRTDPPRHLPPGDIAISRPPQPAAQPNRFRMLLDAAANPRTLPEPEPPKGIILGKDSE